MSDYEKYEKIEKTDPEELITMVVMGILALADRDRALVSEVFRRVIDDEPRLVYHIPQMIATVLANRVEQEQIKVADFAHNTLSMMEPSHAKDPGLRARAIRDVLLSHQFRSAPVEMDLERELAILSKDPKVVEYLDLFQYGKRPD